jgi:hypothetical protein
LEQHRYKLDRYALVSIVHDHDAPIVYRTPYYVEEPFILERWNARSQQLSESHPELSLAGTPLRVALKSTVSNSPQPRVKSKYLPTLNLWLAVGETGAVVVDSSILPSGLSLSRRAPAQ